MSNKENFPKAAKHLLTSALHCLISPPPSSPPSHPPRSALRLPPTPRPSTFNSSALQTSSIFPSFATTDADSITLPPPPAPLLPFSPTRKCWLRRRRKQKALVKQEWHRTISIEVVSGERAMVAVLFALRAFAKQMLLLYQSLRCVSCLSVPSKMRCKGLSCLSLWLQFWFTWKSPCGFSIVFCFSLSFLSSYMCISYSGLVSKTIPLKDFFSIWQNHERYGQINGIARLQPLHLARELSSQNFFP